jgi:hypothetical protein
MATNWNFCDQWLHIVTMGCRWLQELSVVNPGCQWLLADANGYKVALGN